ncbi:ferredoxin [Nocardia jiangxiensis]|uniref:ferredoxin n=1 Tax=Nocardia jiangxiensis TaxID=282685 RepID=UPI0003104AEC
MSEQGWRVEVSRGCIGSGLCLSVAADHFEFAGARAKTVRGVLARAEDLEAVRAAAEICPASAISISENLSA